MDPHGPKRNAVLRNKNALRNEGLSNSYIVSEMFFFVAQLLLFFSSLFCPLCFTSTVSLTGFYTKNNPNYPDGFILYFLCTQTVSGY